MKGKAARGGIWAMALAVLLAGTLALPAPASAAQFAAAQVELGDTVDSGQVQSLADARTTRSTVWAGADSVSFASVTVGDAVLTRGEDYTVAYYEGVERFSKARYGLDGGGRIVALPETGGSGASASTAAPADGLAEPDVAPAFIFQDASYLYAGVPHVGAFAADGSYAVVLTGTGAYEGVHGFAFKAHDVVAAKNLKQESQYYAYTGKAVKPVLYVGSATAADRELMQMKQCRLTYTKRLFSAKTAVSKAVGYSNYNQREWYQVKVAGTSAGKVTGSKTLSMRIYRSANISQCIMTANVATTHVGECPEFSLWYPKSAGYGDYVPDFLYTMRFIDAEGNVSEFPSRAGTYTLEVAGKAEFGCKGKQTRTVKLVAKKKDIASLARIVVAARPAKANGYKPRFKVVNVKTGNTIAKKYYTARYIDYYDRSIANFKASKGKGAIVCEGRNGYTGHMTYYLGQD